MNLELYRREPYTDRFIDSIYVTGVFECFGLEDTDRHLETGGIKIPGKTAIPRGKYQIIIDWSDRFKCLMLHVLDVPQFDGIRIHAGNTPENTDGCILVGKNVTYDLTGGLNPVLAQSVMALKDLTLKIYDALLSGEKIWLEIK